VDRTLSQTRGAARPLLKSAIWASLALVAVLPVAAQEEGLEQILEAQIARYPRMQPQDLYKLLHQAAMGSEHAVSDREAARLWLFREIETLESPGPEEPLMEPLSPDGQLVRVNLRPFVRMGGDAAVLSEAFVQTSNLYTADPATLERYCDQAVTLAREGALPFAASELEALFTRQEQQGYPAVHHSEGYADAYRPAYRVVLRELLNED
jgi:hypothetical protein